MLVRDCIRLFSASLAKCARLLNNNKYHSESFYQSVFCYYNKTPEAEQFQEYDTAELLISSGEKLVASGTTGQYPGKREGYGIRQQGKIYFSIFSQNLICILQQCILSSKGSAPNGFSMESDHQEIRMFSVIYYLPSVYEALALSPVSHTQFPTSFMSTHWGPSF